MKQPGKPRSAPVKVLLLCGLLLCHVGAGAGCTSSAADGKRTKLIGQRPTRAELNELDDLRKLFVFKHKNYEDERDKLFSKKAWLAQWYVYGLVSDAVRDYDDMKALFNDPSGFLLSEASKGRFFWRTQHEIHHFGKLGRDTIMTHFMRDNRAVVREVGKLLFDVHSLDELMPAIEAEFAGNSRNAKKALLELLGLRKADERARLFVQKSVASKSWQIRGLATGILARSWKDVDGVEGAPFFWRLFRTDKDSFVRRKALEALGILGDMSQVRPLVEKLGALVQEGRGKDAEACAVALRMLTGQRFGLSYRAWSDWLGR